MNNLVSFCVTSTVETALKKLNKVNIAVYKLKKRGLRVYFSVEEEYVQKVFAIFSHPCYNINIRRKSAKARALAFLGKRFGLVVGAVLFVAAGVISNVLVLKIKVVGNGSYLSPQIISAAEECGAKRGTPCSGLDKPLLTARILSLPSVTFCSVQKKGAYLVIEVRTDEEHCARTDDKPLVCDAEGEVRRIVALSGTAEKKEGDKVTVGETLIGAYRLAADGQRQSALAVGFAEIIRTAAITLFYESESDENLASALASTALYSDRVLQKQYRVTPCEGGVNYDITFTYLYTLSVNME